MRDARRAREGRDHRQLARDAGQQAAADRSRGRGSGGGGTGSERPRAGRRGPTGSRGRGPSRAGGRARRRARARGSAPASADSSVAARRQPDALAGSSSDTAPARRIVPGPACIDERGGAAVEDGLARADRHDEVGLDERGMDAMDVTGDLEGPEVLRLAVVNGDLAAEARGPGPAAGAARARGGRRDGGGRRRRGRCAARAGRRASSSSSRTAARTSLRGSCSTEGSGSAGGCTTIVARPPRGATASEGRPRQRVAEGLGDRGADVHEGVERRRRRDEHRVVGEGDERKPGAGVEGDAEHVGHLHGRIGRDRPTLRRCRGTGGRTSDGIRGAATSART